MNRQSVLSNHSCHNPDCRKPCPPKWLMCYACWSKVPKPLQAAVYRTYRKDQEQGKRPSAAWHRAADAAIQSVCPTYKGVPEHILKIIEDGEKYVRKPIMAKIWRGKP